MIKKFIITRYDESITEPPFLTIKIDEMEVRQPENDTLGSEFCERIRCGCRAKGYKFKFYTMASEIEGFDFEVVVE